MTTNTTLTARRSALSAEQRALLQQRLRGGQAQAAGHIPRRAHEGPAPASFAQQRLWFLQQLAPASAAYNDCTALRLRGVLRAAVVEVTVREILRRHTLLCSAFAMADGQLVQTTNLNMHKDWTLPVIDLQHLPAHEREQAAQRVAADEAQRPFALAEAPLVRVVLLQLGADDHVLLTTIHHTVFDGWSSGLLNREIATIYAAFAAGTPSPLPDLAVQYADFAAWEQQQFQGAALEAELGYWRQQLAGPLPVLQLPTDRTRPAQQQFRGAARHRAVPAALHTQMQALSQREGVTPFMLLLAVFQVLLYRHSGQDDMVIGTPIAGRHHAELEPVIGPFLNHLALRADLTGDPDFRTLLQRARTATLGAYAHQDLPFEKIVEDVQPVRDPSRTSMFQAMFLLQNFPHVQTTSDTLTLMPFAYDDRPSEAAGQCDLTLLIEETRPGLALTLSYDATLFDASSIDRMLKQFETLLADAIAQPDRPIAALDLLDADERQQLLVAWNATASDMPDQCVHQMIAQQAAHAPDAIAIAFEEQQLSYGELNRRANQLARYLQRLGVGPNRYVGMCGPRAPEAIIGFLGVLKAGAAYVPLDPAYPPERLAMMIDDAQIGIVLTQQHLVAQLELGALHTICLDTDWEQIAAESDADIGVEVGPTDAAYVIYTSGSTGRPKGVVVQHGSLANYTVFAARTYDLQPGDRVLQFASLSFDASAEEIYPTLVRGAQLVLRTDWMLGSPWMFFRTCQEWQISVLNLPTAYWHELAALDQELAIPPLLRLTIIGGERALPERVASWRRAAPQARLVNTYGPTEATIVATLYEVPRDATGSGRELPIGRPVDNTQIYLLDRAMQPVPIGVAGELYIGGAGVARGYLGQAQLTAARFVADPFGGPGARLYRSGDLARYLPDGNLEFLGRIDQQVKIRGFRIELGDIQAALHLHPDVRESVVLAREETPGAKRLVAYIVAGDQRTPTVDDLRAFLRTRLPEYMLPSWFVFVANLPRTPNGKLDTQALPALEADRANLGQTYVAPRTPIEQILADIWAAALGLDQVGVDDSFFALGGHSLLVAQVIYQANTAFAVDLPLRALFDEPTIAGLALLVEDLFLCAVAELDETELLPRSDMHTD